MPKNAIGGWFLKRLGHLYAPISAEGQHLIFLPPDLDRIRDAISPFHEAVRDREAEAGLDRWFPAVELDVAPVARDGTAAFLSAAPADRLHRLEQDLQKEHTAS